MSLPLIRPVKPKPSEPIERRDVSADADLPLEGLAHESGPPRKLTKLTVAAKDITQRGWSEEQANAVLLAELKDHAYRHGWTFDTGEEKYAVDDVTGDRSVYCFLRVSPLAMASRQGAGRRMRVPNILALLRQFPKRKST